LQFELFPLFVLQTFVPQRSEKMARFCSETRICGAISLLENDLLPTCCTKALLFCHFRYTGFFMYRIYVYSAFREFMELVETMYAFFFLSYWSAGAFVFVM